MKRRFEISVPFIKGAVSEAFSAVRDRSASVWCVRWIALLLMVFIYALSFPNMVNAMCAEGASHSLFGKGTEADSLRLKDQNHLTVRSIDDPVLEKRKYYWLWKNHHQTNHGQEALFLNGRYAHSFMGLDTERTEALQNKPLWAWWSDVYVQEEAPRDSFFLCEGMLYRKKIHLSCSGYTPELLSLLQISRRFAPNVNPDDYLFMCDGVLLTHNLHGFRYDVEFLEKVVCRSVSTYPLPQESEKNTYPLSLNLKLMDIRTRAKTDADSVGIQEKGKGVRYFFPKSGRESLFDGKCRYWLNDSLVGGSYIGLDLEKMESRGAKCFFKSEKKEDYAGGIVRFLCKSYTPRLVSLRDI